MLSGTWSWTTQSWPPRNRRVTMLAPMRPRPIMPICIFMLLRGESARSPMFAAIIGQGEAVDMHATTPDAHPEPGTSVDDE